MKRLIPRLVKSLENRALVVEAGASVFKTVRLFPTVCYYRNGQLQAEWVGLTEAAEIEEKVWKTP
jgi:hypothetical protein